MHFFKKNLNDMKNDLLIAETGAALNKALLKEQEEGARLRKELTEKDWSIADLQQQVEELTDEQKEAAMLMAKETTIHTSLGALVFHNATGNMQLQMELDAFAQALKEKY